MTAESDVDGAILIYQHNRLYFETFSIGGLHQTLQFLIGASHSSKQHRIMLDQADWAPSCIFAFFWRAVCSLAAQKRREKKREKVNSAARLLTFFPCAGERERESNTYEFRNIKNNFPFNHAPSDSDKRPNKNQMIKRFNVARIAARPSFPLPLFRHFADRSMLISNECALSHASQYVQEVNSKTNAHLHWNRIVAESNWNSSWRKWVKFSAANELMLALPPLHCCCWFYCFVLSFALPFLVMQSRFVAKTRSRDIFRLLAAVLWKCSIDRHRTDLSLRKMIADFLL